MKGLTDTEKAALYFQIFERCADWRRVYAIAVGADRYNALTESGKQSAPSRWKTSHRIQSAYDEILRNIEAMKEAEREKGRNDAGGIEETEAREQRKKRANDDETDFLNRDEFLKFLNTRANEVQDDKMRNDILKMLSDNLRYKDVDKEAEAEIQRYYTPLTCQDCEIYKKCKGCEQDKCPKML